jgi:hypothetical protein
MADIFWSAPNSDPKRGFRFVLNIGGWPVWVVKSVKKPSFSINPIEHDFLNHKFRYPGKLTWDSPIDVTVVDPINPDMAKSILDVITQSGYVAPTTSPDAARSVLSTLSKESASKALGNVEIDQIDGDGNAVETWKLMNPWISKVDYGELAYDNEDLTEITLSIEYDWAEMTVNGSPVAAGGGATKLDAV